MRSARVRQLGRKTARGRQSQISCYLAASDIDDDGVARLLVNAITACHGETKQSREGSRRTAASSHESTEVAASR